MPKTTQNGFLFDDWNLPEEESSIGNVPPPFDGKIIARMPDLGSEGIAPKNAKSEFTASWEQVSSSVFSIFPWKSYANMGTGQRLFRRIIDCGIIVLLCGIGIHFIGYDTDKPTAVVAEPAAKQAAVKPVADAKPAAETATKSATEKPVADAKPNEEPAAKLAVADAASLTVPVAPVENLVAASSPKQTSPWDRPAVDSQTIQDAVPTQPESTAPNGNAVAVDATSTVLSETVAMAPMTPIAGASMAVSPYEMAVSPFELQMVPQSNVLPSGGTPIQPHHPTVPPGMMAMHGRQENMPGIAPQQTPPWQTPAPQQYLPPGHGQAAPINKPQGQFGQQPGYYMPQGQAGQQQGQFAQQHNQFAQQGGQQYVVPPGYMAQHQAAPQNMPIPSGVSTLPPQNGQYMYPNGMPIQNTQPQGMPLQGAANDFYNAPPAYRQVY